MLKKLCLVSAAFALTVAASVGTASSNHHCPPPRHYSGVCIQVVVWAQDPNSGTCCMYGNPCSAPAGWTIFYGPNCTNPEIIEL